ncbi:hypothetical protein SAMN02745191_0564 [Anaerorhabdus furcosa]|uniref:Phosphatidylglycerol lysyltransferase C-terminal domain-containing protein n=2 Tax=Anaerorhabdus furcosa TaxID=118967 RepID=A0A1T4KJD1_9FIRM|nr:hypothetical protein SAMN02745191_0564 [Anaerorhabdus furcosa]
MQNIRKEVRTMTEIEIEMYHDFLPVSKEQWEKIKEYLSINHYEESNHNLVNMILWLEWYPLFCVEHEHYLLLLGIHEGELFLYMPLCKDEYFNEAIVKAKSIFDHYGVKFVLSCFTKEAMDKVLMIYPEYCACPARESYDYVYRVEKLMSFSGKKLQKKRNHLNAFYKDYENRFVYEAMNKENVVECKAFLEKWKAEDEDAFLQSDRKGTMRILDLFGEIEYRGGCIRIDGEIKAFAIGSILSKRMCQENIEKADPTIRGLYQALIKEFLSHEFSEFEYVNREDDMGYDNLRQAKMAYYPEFMIEKYRLCREGENRD